MHRISNWAFITNLNKKHSELSSKSLRAIVDQLLYTYILYYMRSRILLLLRRIRLPFPWFNYVLNIFSKIKMIRSSLKKRNKLVGHYGPPKPFCDGSSSQRAMMSDHRYLRLSKGNKCLRSAIMAYDRV